MSTATAFTTPDKGSQQLHLLIESLHCPSCVTLIETALKKQPEVESARLNLSTRRLTLRWHGAPELAERYVALLTAMGYRAMPYDPATLETSESREEKFLLRCLAVAGFASGNLMLFSIPVWSSDGMEMGAATRTLFHWFQAAIAIPALAYAGRPFYRSAWSAVKEWRTNMDVPISVAVILATGMSLFETITGGHYAYFDSGVMLLFFLLIGRYLETRARGRARKAASDLLHMAGGRATLLLDDGSTRTIPLSEIRPGMRLQVAAGEKISADANVATGHSELDTSLITGETTPQPVSPGSAVFAGTLNLSAPLILTVTRAHERSLLSDIIRLMETAEQGQARYVTLADRISGWYTPVVHALAALAFAGWFMAGAPWQVALLIAATVLIITCPCALGLAVPVVQVLASGVLMRKGILLKSGSALERLATVTHVAFDKTGTLTLGRPQLTAQPDEESLRLAASLASHSKHPLAKALTQAYHGALLPLNVQEIPGHGLQSGEIRLGRGSWAAPGQPASTAGLELWLARPGHAPVPFTFSDALRPDAASVIASLSAQSLHSSLLSGDRPDITAAVARQLGIESAQGGLTPLEKTRIIEQLKASGQQVLMVGDGLNDAPSLATANISMSPASAIDITQNAADIVFQGEKLAPILTALRVARFSQSLVRQNFALAVLYNIIAIPLALAGLVTPMVAAIAMSSSSLLVIMNALRLTGKEGA